MSANATDLVRQIVRDAGGRAKLADIYTQATAHSIRTTSAAVEAMLERGELHEAGGEYWLFSKPEMRGPKGHAHERLWRAAHRRSERAGGFTTRDLAQLARVTQWSAVEWIREMRQAGRLVKVAEKARASVCRVCTGQPGPDNPPPFRWPRRGKAKTSWDK